MKKFLIFCSSVLIVTIFEVWLFRPNWTYYIFVAILLTYSFLFWLFINRNIFSSLFWKAFLNPFIFLVSASAFFIFIDEFIVGQIFLFCVAVGYYLVMHSLYSFFHQTKDYQPYALENMYSYLNLVSFFLVNSAFYGFSLIMGIQIWIFVIPSLLTAFLLFYRTLQAHKLAWKDYWVYLLIISLIIAETFFIVGLLPTSYLFDGLVVTAIYYLMSSAAKDYLVGTLSRKSLRNYSLISLVIIIILFLTAQWY